MCFVEDQVKEVYIYISFMLEYRIILVFAGDLIKYICIVHEQKTALISNFLYEKRSQKNCFDKAFLFVCILC